MDGFLLIDKPVGLSSHDVVYRVKRQLNLKKVGHTGTLDPFASGLMILCLGKATKLAYLFQNLDKRYEATIKFGVHYDTFDHTGTLLSSNPYIPTEDSVDLVMQQMTKSYEQLPPMYSALKINGQKLYELARKGIEVERNTRLVDIYDFKRISKLEKDTLRFYAHVSKGTYIRTLAVDLATNLNTLATLTALKRMSVGKYLLDNATTIENLKVDDIIRLETYFSDTPTLVLDDYLVKLVKNGVYLDERQLKTNEPFIVLDQNKQMIAYYEVEEENRYKPILIF